MLRTNCKLLNQQNEVLFVPLVKYKMQMIVVRILMYLNVYPNMLLTKCKLINQQNDVLFVPLRVMKGMETNDVNRILMKLIIRLHKLRMFPKNRQRKNEKGLLWTWQGANVTVVKILIRFD
jgi:hypothetical protein